MITTALKVGGSLFGGYEASRAMKKVRALLAEQERENQNWYDRRMSQDYTQTAEAQNAMRKARDYAETLNRQAAGAKAMTGGTDEAVANTKAQNNQLMADTMADIAAQGTAQKEAVEQTYQARRARLKQAKAGLYQQQADEIVKAAGQLWQ